MKVRSAGRKKLRIATGLLGAGALALMIACGGGEGADAGRAAGGGEQSAGAADVGGQPGQTAPDFRLQRLAGGDLTLSSLRGKAVLIDFWDTWCGPCRKSLPYLEALHREYGDDLVVVGIAMARYGEAEVRKFVAQNGLTMETVLFNQDVGLLDRFGGLEGIPTTLLIDRDGVVRNRWIGGHGKAVYEDAVRKVLGA